MRFRWTTSSRAAAIGLSLSMLGGLLTSSACRKADDPTTRLLRQLPADQALYLFIDVARFRNSPALESLLRKTVALPPNVGDLANSAGMDYLADADSAAISLGSRGTNLAVRGRFDEAALRKALAGNGVDCPSSLRVAPCKIEARGTRPALSIVLRAEDLLRISVGPNIAAPPTEEALQKLVVDAREQLNRGALMWATFAPSLTEDAIGPATAGLQNLRFFARALEKAHRGYFYAEELPDGKLQVTLKASCGDTQQAESVSNLLTGLNRLAAATLEAGRGDDPPPEARVLRSARIASTETTVVAVWVLDAITLRAWGIG